MPLEATVEVGTCFLNKDDHEIGGLYKVGPKTSNK